jgi:hypothetical protein
MFFFRNIPYVEENIVEPERLLVLAAASLVVSHALFLSTTTEDQYKALAWLQINGLRKLFLVFHWKEWAMVFICLLHVTKYVLQNDTLGRCYNYRE